MIWELDRHQWAILRTVRGTAEGVPLAIRELAASATPSEADRWYWGVDNVVVRQGSLFEGAVAATSSLLAALHQCSDVARPSILELLQQLGNGEPDPTEIERDTGDLRADCLRELLRGYPMFECLLEI